MRGNRTEPWRTMVVLLVALSLAAFGGAAAAGPGPTDEPGVSDEGGAMPDLSREGVLSQISLDCDDPVRTAALSAGPYYKENSPERDSLIEEDAQEGPRLYLAGYAVDTDCNIVTDARIDFWATTADNKPLDQESGSDDTW